MARLRLTVAEKEVVHLGTREMVLDGLDWRLWLPSRGTIVFCLPVDVLVLRDNPYAKFLSAAAVGDRRAVALLETQKQLTHQP